MHTFDETTRNLQRVIFSFSAHFFLVYVSCLYRSQTPFAFSSLFAYSYSIPPQKLRNLSSSSSSPLFVVMPVGDVPNFGPMMASLSPLLKRRVSHLKQARESRIGSRSTGTQEQEVQEVFRSSDPRVQNPSALYMNILHVRYLSPTN